MKYQKGNKSKISIYNHIASTALFVRGQFECPKIIEVCFIIISSLQTLMMIIHPTFNLNPNIEVNSSLEALYTLLIRPELFIIINRNLQKELLYIFVLIIVIVHKLGFSVLVFVLHKNSSSDKFQQQIQHSLLIQIFVKFLSYYQQLLCPLFIVPFNALILISIKELISLVLDGYSMNYIHLLFGILTFIILQIDQLTACTMNKQPLTFKLNCLERQKITESHFIIYLSQTLSNLIFTLMPDQFSVTIAQYFIVLVIQVMAIRNQYVNQIYIYQYQEMCLYTGYIFQLIYSIIQLLKIQWQIDNQEFLLIVITPLFLGFIVAFSKQRKDRQFLLFFQVSDLSDIEILLSVLVNILNKNDIVESHIVLRSSLINYYHQKKCQLKTCGCTSTYYIAEPKQSNAITTQIFKSFIFDKLQQIKKTIYQKNSKYYCSQEMLISYSILLYDFGWMMLAARSFNKLLLNNNKVPGSFTNAPAKNKSELQKQTKEMTLKSATLLYKKFKSAAESENAGKNEMKIFFQIDLGVINKERLLLLSNQTKWNMKATFGSSLNAAQQTFISDSINQYLKYEFVVQNCKEKLVHLLQQRNLFYTNLMKEKQQNTKKIYNITNKICKLLHECETYFRISFLKYPSARLQKALTFFYAELMNDMLEANRVYHQSVNSDLQFIQNNHHSLNLTQQQSAYVILSLNEDLRHLEIQSISSQMLKFIGKPHSTNLCFSEILPLFFYQYHPEMVNEFLNSGKSRYYRNFSPTFINIQDCLLKGVQICYDTTQLYHNQQLVFVAFFQNLMYENSYVIVDDFDRNFVGLSYNFLTKLGYDENLIKKMIKHKYLNDLNIYNIFPKFDEALEKSGNNNIILTEDIYFFDYQKVRQSTIIETQEKRASNLDPFVWRQKEKIMKFNARLSILKRIHTNFSYFIVEIQELQQQQKIENTFDEVADDIDYESSKNESSSFDGLISLRSDDHPNQINILETNHQINLFSPIILRNTIQNDTSARHIQTQTRVTLTNQCEEKLLKQSSNSQMKINSMHSQQAFYNSKLSHLIGGEDKYSVIIDQEIESRDKEQEEQKQEYAQSQSSVASINLSVNFKKYELIQKITSIRPTLKINQFIGFLLFQNFVLIIYLILVLVLMPQDLRNSTEQINMIGVHADIMAPHDLYFSMRITISAYQQLLSQKFINNSQFTELTDPYYNNINLGYEELKKSIYLELNNQYIQSYYDDYYLVSKLMKDNDTQIVTQNLTFREVLLTNLQYQYTYQRIYQQRQSPSGKPCQVFIYANYFNINDMLEQFSEDILSISKSQSANVIQKWLILWLLLVVVIILISLMSFYYQNEHLLQYDRFLSLLNYFTVSYLEQEINKQKMLQQIIQHDENYVFQYEFNLDRNYNKPEKQQISSTHIQFKEKKYKKKLKMSRMRAILFTLFLASLYITYSTIVNQTNSNFFNKFKKTTDFYKQIADLKLRAGSIIFQKEIFYRLSNFTYFTSSDIDRLYQYVAKALKVISNYVIQVNSYDFSNLLVSDSFIAEYTTIQTTNLCEYLTPEFSAFMFTQCTLAFSGTLLNGTVQSLNYIVNQVKSEQGLNNFTKRIDVHMYEQEGSQVVTRVFTQLSLSLANTIVQIIDSQFYFCQTLSIIFFIFAIIWTILIVKWLRNHLISEHDLIKKIINIAPSQMLITDDSYERQLRLIAQQQENY